MAVEASEPEARMERKEEDSTVLYSVFNAGILSNLTYRVKKPFVGGLVVGSFWRKQLIYVTGKMSRWERNESLPPLFF
jgi:hypothetical protein